MKTSELNLKKDGYLFNCKQKIGQYTFLMSLGRLFPATKAQATFFLKNGVVLDVLNMDDVEVVEALLNKHGMSGDYAFTKSKTWVRLINQNDLHKAIKLEYNI